MIGEANPRDEDLELPEFADQSVGRRDKGRKNHENCSTKKEQAGHLYRFRRKEVSHPLQTGGQ